MSSPFADLLRKLLEPAKRPETISTLERQVELLGELDVALSEVRMAREKLRQEASRLQTRAPILEDQAKRALSNGREDFARTALGRRKAVLLELKALDQQMIEVEQEEDRLRTVEQRLSVSLEAYRARRDVLSAREKAAVAQVRAGQVMGGVAAGTAELNQALERAEENRKRIQARSLVINRLIESGVVEDPAEMSALDSASDHDVEQELQALKGQLLQQSLGGPAS